MDTLVESRADDALQMIEPGCIEQERLGGRSVGLCPTAEDDLADALGLLRAARLAGHAHPVAESFDPAAQPLDLGGLAGPLPALERDEPSTHQPRFARDEKARRTRSPPTSRSPSSAFWLSVPSATSSPA